MTTRSWNLIYACIGSIIWVVLLGGAFWSAKMPLQITNDPNPPLPEYVGALKLSAFLEKPIIAASRSFVPTDKKKQPDFDVTAIELTGIMHPSANKTVIYFNYQGVEHNKELTQNDIFADWTVSTITPEKIILSRADKLYTLTIEGSK